MNAQAEGIINEHLRAYSAFLETQGSSDALIELRDLFAEANRADTVVHRRPAPGRWRHYECANHRVISTQGSFRTHLQTPYIPERHERAGIWYGYEDRIDDAGRSWTRRINAVVNDFGDLVEVSL